jgi:hypothetical protein
MSRFQLFITVTLLLLVGWLITLTLVQFRGVQDLAGLKTEVTQTAQDNSVVAPDFSETIASQAATLADLTARLESLEEKPTQKTTTTNPAVSFQKQVIYLGSASTNKNEWTNTGLEVTLDSADYPANVQTIFEAGLSIVGGEAGARLINKTSGAIITASEVSHNTNTVTWKTSSSFKLHSGKNIYAVQARSTSGEIANVAGARLVISQ